MTTFKMPKAGLYDAQGRITKAGHKYFTGIENAVNQGNFSLAQAGDADGVLEGGNKLIRSDGLWETMANEPESGFDTFTPDLGHRLDFEFTLTGATVMRFPANVPFPGLPFFSVLFRQDATGGRSLTFDGGFAGEAVEILDAANDATLCGFKVLSTTQWTGWAIKGMAATV